MKNISLVLLFFLLSVTAYCQEKITLKWNIPVGDTIAYKTIMESVDISEQTPTNKINDDSIMTALSSIVKELQEGLKETMKNKHYEFIIYKSPIGQDIDLELALIDTVDNGKINIMDMVNSMIDDAKNNDEWTEADQNALDSMNFQDEKYKDNITIPNKTVTLRGRITPNGQIVSNYYKTQQKNLIAMLFQLPNKNVAVGERWKIDVSYIQMDQNFYCDSLNNVNEVYIEKIETENEDRVAIIRYNLKDYVSGTFNSPFGGEKGVYIGMRYEAIGRFSINKGRWLSFDGSIYDDSDFSPLGKQKTKTIIKLY